MKIGDYVRTKWRIAKITSLNVYCNLVVETERGCIDTDKIIKSTPNIIDLIEVGDYVNGYKVSFVDEEPVMGKFVQCDYNHYRFYEADIKSIVTKEQFESMEYKIC